MTCANNSCFRRVCCFACDCRHTVGQLYFISVCEQRATKMNSSSNASHVSPPAVVWAQRKDKILLTIQLENCSNPTIDIKDSSLYFKGKGGTGNVDHEVLMEFNKEIDPQACKHQATGREIIFVLMKKEESHGFWPRLLKDSKKVHYLKTDFDKWRDEDDSDVEEQEDFNLDEMMQSMGGLPGGAPPGLGEEEDSDDEELPDLQQ
ncbi:co-chaperone protein daf-41 isoform X2 [Aplysia californica]|uniref:Co-chaperone protein daf-41 isoform X2 n=1 Tax=Aplysia californica TaxID=6500 RepID=A0ABM0JPZ5_APLCA|nr:co-chaperone protein daf-41 isoform X2 [Aplysia californica]